MKKRIYLIIVILIIVLLLNICIPIFSKATTTATVYLESNKNIVEKDEEIEVTLNVRGQKVAAYSANIYFDETKFDYISGPENINIEGNRIIIVWYDEQGGSGSKEGELSKLIFKAKEEGLSNFTIEGEFFTERSQLIQTSFENIQVQIGREETYLEKQAKEEQGTNSELKNADLQAIRINQEGLVPNFQTDIYKYDLIVSNDINDIEVLAIAENPNAKIDIEGNTRIKRRN